MLPTVLVMIAAMVYAAVACVVWFTALVLAIPRRTRPLAGKIAAGMAGTFPGVLVFLCLSAPIAVVALVVAGLTSRYIHPLDTVMPLFLFGVMSILVIAAILGFYTGWRFAWQLLSGRSARSSLESDPIIGAGVRFLNKRFPALAKAL
jgi:asparagine N-glycosylation enzyme membrane subunit Stt3